MKEVMITMMGKSIDNGEDDSNLLCFDGLNRGGGTDCGEGKCGQCGGDDGGGDGQRPQHWLGILGWGGVARDKGGDG